VVARCYAAVSLWLLGAPEQALAQVYAAHTVAQELGHPYSLAFALQQMMRLYQWWRDVPATLTWTETAMALCAEHGFGQYFSHGRLLHGWALMAQGQKDEGVSQMRQSLIAYEATGAAVVRPYFLAVLAEGYGQVGVADEGLQALAEALVTVQHTGEQVWEAELYRLKGELLLASSVEQYTEAESCFRQAIEIARRQQAKSLELRAALSLTRLWQQQGKRQEAHDLLAPVYGWFPEGFDTADLQEAKALLDALRGRGHQSGDA